MSTRPAWDEVPGAGQNAETARGMVTAELAVTTLTAFVLLITMCWGIYLIVTQVRIGDTAAAVARQAARDDRRRNGQSGGRRTTRRRGDRRPAAASWSP